MIEEKLDVLIEAVKAGTATGRIGNLCADTLLTEHMIDIGKANAGSLDAAKELHEALVPDYDFETFRLHGEVLIKRIKPIDRHYGWADLNPARAWLLAILKAYRTQVTK